MGEVGPLSLPSPVTLALGLPYLSVASWNMRTLNLADSGLAARTKAIVGGLAEAHHLTWLIEARGTVQAQRAWTAQWHISHHIYCSEAGPGEAAAGMVLFAQKDFMAKYNVISKHSEIFGGRACAIELSSPHGPPAYSLCVHAERFDARMMAALTAVRRSLGDSVTSASPRAGCGVVVGGTSFFALRTATYGAPPRRVLLASSHLLTTSGTNTMLSTSWERCNH